jgi:carbonic anhydrase
VISQRFLGADEIVVLHHIDCGMPTLRDELKRRVGKKIGKQPSFTMEAFPDVTPSSRWATGSPIHPTQGQRARLHLRRKNRPAERSRPDAAPKPSGEPI